MRKFLIITNLILGVIVLLIMIKIFFFFDDKVMLDTVRLENNVPASLPLSKSLELKHYSDNILSKNLFQPQRGKTFSGVSYSSQKPPYKLIGLMEINNERMAVIVEASANTAEQTTRRLFRVNQNIAEKITLIEIKDNSVVLQLSDGILEMPLERDKIRASKLFKVDLVQ